MTETTLTPRRWKKPPFIKDARLRWAIGLGAAIYLALAFGTMDVNWGRVAEGLPRGVKFIAAFFPPDFFSRADEILDGIYESLWMTVTSTVVGIALSIPVGLGAARNLAPRAVYLFCRGILAVSRSFQEVILAIFFENRSPKLREFWSRGYYVWFHARLRVPYVHTFIIIWLWFLIMLYAIAGLLNL